MDLFKRKRKTVFDDQGRPLPNGWTTKATSKSLFKFSSEPFTNEEQIKEYIEETYAEVLTSLPKYQREHYTKEVHLKFLKHRDVDSFEISEENLYQQGVEAVKDLNTAGAIPSEIVDAMMKQISKPQNYKMRQEMRLALAQGKIYKKTQAWQANATKQMSHFLLWSDILQKAAVDEEGILKLQVTTEGKGIINCDTYLWTQETLELAQSMPSPHHLLMDEHLLSSPSMFMVFEQGLYLKNLKGEEMACSWVMVCMGADRISISHDALDEVTDNIVAFEFPVNTIYPLELNSDYDGAIPVEHQQLGLEFILKLLCFLKTKAAEIEHRVTERTFRREMKRKNIEVEPEETRIIRLRKVTYRGEVVPVGDGTKKTIRWKGQWWVQGHWRNQAYGPNMSLRKAKWIPTYSKGNKTAPFIEKTFLVER